MMRGAVLALALAFCVGLMDIVRTLTHDELQAILSNAEEINEWLVSHRRELHQIPETMYDEVKTSQYIRDVLDELGIEYEYPFAKTGIVGTIGAGEPMVTLRADIDALPVHEATGLPFASRTDGRMHACGHDAHITMLLGGARLLKEAADSGRLKGTVRLMFQPAEEGGAGGDVMVKQGALGTSGAAFAFHVWPAIPTGIVSTKPGVIMAGAARFNIRVVGKGGHAAMPHTVVDPVVAAAGVVRAVQTIVSREVDPLESAVVSVTKFHAGEAFNVIPDEALLGGTIRSLSVEGMQRLMKRFEEIVQLEAQVHGCIAEVDWREETLTECQNESADAATSQEAQVHGCIAEVDWNEETLPWYPPTVNDDATAAFVADIARRMLGEERFETAVPSMGGEDFGFVALAVPSTYTFLGIRNEDLGSVWPLHSPRFMLDEEVLPLGAAMHTALALEWLETNAGDHDEL